MSSPFKAVSRRAYNDAFSDDSRVASPSTSSTFSSSSSSNSASKGKVKRGPPKWNPFERYPEFLERGKWLREENQLLSEEEEEFQRFVHGYEKYKAKHRAGEPFWEEVRRSLPSFNLDTARDERCFIGYDEEGNEVRYDDEKHFLKRVRQREILKFQADCRKAMKEREDCRRRHEEEKISKGDVKEKQGKEKRATRKYDMPFVGKKQGLRRENGLRRVNEMKQDVKRDGKSHCVVVNKVQKGRKNPRRHEAETGNETENNGMEKMAEKNNKRPICQVEGDNDVQTPTKKMNAVSYDLEKNADRDFGGGHILLQIQTRDDPGHSGERSHTGDTRNDDKAQQFQRDEFAFDGKFLSDDEKELEKSRGRDKRRNRGRDKDDDADRFEYKVTEEDYLIPGFEEEAEFNGDDIGNGSDIEHLAEILERTENILLSPLRDDTMKTKQNYETEDAATEYIHDYDTSTGYNRKTNLEKPEETEEEDRMEEDEVNEEEDRKMGHGGDSETALIFRHSLRFQKELEERKKEEVRQKVLNDLADMDVTLELLMMDFEGRDAGEEEEESGAE